MDQELTLWTQRDLIAIRKDMRLERSSDFFRKTFFGRKHFSDNKEIHFGKIEGTRAMAPFAVPSSMGIPIVKERGATLESFTPGYIKLLDAVRAEDATTVLPDEILQGRLMTMQERFNVRTAEVALQHMRAIERTRDWLACRAVIDGKVTIKYEHDQGMPNPEVVIDFGRNPNHTVAYAAGADWSDPTTNIFHEVQGYLDIARKSQFGGALTRMLVGSNVVKYFQENTSIVEKLDTQIRGGEGTQFTRGLQFYNEDDNVPTYIGRLGGNGGSVDVFHYADVQLDNDGNELQMLDPNDIFLYAPGVEGVEAFGAIYDLKAIGGKFTGEVFSKQYEQENPSVRNMLTQCAPLPLVLNPNRTFKATVVRQ